MSNHLMVRAGLSAFINPPKEPELDPVATPFMCLAFVRMIIMRAYGISWNDFYTRMVVNKVERNNGKPTYWIARDAERAFRDKWSVAPNAYAPGDIVFNHKSFKDKYDIYEGHVGVYLGPQLFQVNGQWVVKNLVIENAPPSNRTVIASKGFILLSDFDKWMDVTTYVRLPLNREELLK